MDGNPRVAAPARVTAHDPHYRPEPDLLDKGLQHDSVGLLGSTAMAISCVAPVYALTAALGSTVREVGVQMPAVFLAGFLPMLALLSLLPAAATFTAALVLGQYAGDPPKLVPGIKLTILAVNLHGLVLAAALLLG